MRKIIFLGIKFIDISDNDFEQIINNNGLFLFPSGPGLSTILSQKEYHRSLKKADFVFFDSGFFVLLLYIFKKIKVNKFSGYKFINKFKSYLKRNPTSIFLIDPNLKLSKNNRILIKNLGFKNQSISNYIAPIYNPQNLKDEHLLKIINIKKPKIILVNIGGGTQEILGYYLKKKLNFKTKIICTGAAISFFTGDQAPNNIYIDKFYLGWMLRIFFNPLVFFKRYLLAFRLFPLVLFNKVKLK
jgi:UDP-N-acetyl-D-mannosaminuronic acid transferase (WecB/TagA/CpsF family)